MATEAWYYGRLTVLATCAILIVSWMLMTAVLAQWPTVGYSINETYGRWLERTTQDRTLRPLDAEEQRERWGEIGADGDRRGQTPLDEWKERRPLNRPKENRHQERGREATIPGYRRPTA
jgi:hypothetical protein